MRRQVHEPSCRWRPAERDQMGRFVSAAGPECGGTFVCVECGRTVGWCRGGDDPDPRLAEMCSACWVRHNRARIAAGEM